MRIVSVAVPVPFLDPLSYAVPEHLDLPPVGARVQVSVGSRVVTGCIVGHAESNGHGGDLKEVLELVDRDPFLPANIVELCCWVADYYVAGVGDANLRGDAAWRAGESFVVQDPPRRLDYAARSEHAGV